MGICRYSGLIFLNIITVFSACKPRQAVLCGMWKNVRFVITEPPVIEYFELPDLLKELREKFTITEIDSTGKIYFIYARSQRSSNLYLILSPKNDTAATELKIGYAYPLVLGSLTRSEDIHYMQLNNTNQPGSHHQKGFPFLLTGYNVKDICFAYNLSGLSITDKPVLKTKYVSKVLY